MPALLFIPTAPIHSSVVGCFCPAGLDRRPLKLDAHFSTRANLNRDNVGSQGGTEQPSVPSSSQPNGNESIKSSVATSRSVLADWKNRLETARDTVSQLNEDLNDLSDSTTPLVIGSDLAEQQISSTASIHDLPLAPAPNFVGLRAPVATARLRDWIRDNFQTQPSSLSSSTSHESLDPLIQVRLSALHDALRAYTHSLADAARPLTDHARNSKGDSQENTTMTYDDEDAEENDIQSIQVEAQALDAFVRLLQIARFELLPPFPRTVHPPSTAAVTLGLVAPRTLDGTLLPSNPVLRKALRSRRAAEAVARERAEERMEARKAYQEMLDSGRQEFSPKQSQRVEERSGAKAGEPMNGQGKYDASEEKYEHTAVSSERVIDEDEEDLLAREEQMEDIQTSMDVYPYMITAARGTTLSRATGLLLDAKARAFERLVYTQLRRPLLPVLWLGRRALLVARKLQKFTSNNNIDSSSNFRGTGTISRNTGSSDVNSSTTVAIGSRELDVDLTLASGISPSALRNKPGPRRARRVVPAVRLRGGVGTLWKQFLPGLTQEPCHGLLVLAYREVEVDQVAVSAQRRAAVASQIRTSVAQAINPVPRYRAQRMDKEEATDNDEKQGKHEHTGNDFDVPSSPSSTVMAYGEDKNDADVIRDGEASTTVRKLGSVRVAVYRDVPWGLGVHFVPKTFLLPATRDLLRVDVLTFSAFVSGLVTFARAPDSPLVGLYAAVSAAVYVVRVAIGWQRAAATYEGILARDRASRLVAADGDALTVLAERAADEAFAQAACVWAVDAGLCSDSSMSAANLQSEVFGVETLGDEFETLAEFVEKEEGSQSGQAWLGWLSRHDLRGLEKDC